MHRRMDVETHDLPDVQKRRILVAGARCAQARAANVPEITPTFPLRHGNPKAYDKKYHRHGGLGEAVS